MAVLHQAPAGATDAPAGACYRLLSLEVLWLADRTRPAVAQVDAADGRAAVQDAGAGPQGGLGARPGVQPDPHGHGPGRGAARDPAAVDQLQGGDADAGGVPAADGAAGPRGTPPAGGTCTSELLDAIATHRVADRPDRFEPRLKKRRKDYCGWLTKPRAELKRQMAKGINEK